MSYQEVCQKLFDFMMEKIEEEQKRTGESRNAISQRLDTSSTTLYRYRDGDRGQHMRLNMILKIFEKLGVPMIEVASKLSPNELEMILPLLDGGDIELLKKMSLIYKAGGRKLEKLREEVDFLAEDLEGYGK